MLIISVRIKWVIQHLSTYSPPWSRESIRWLDQESWERLLFTAACSLLIEFSSFCCCGKRAALLSVPSKYRLPASEFSKESLGQKIITGVIGVGLKMCSLGPKFTKRGWNYCFYGPYQTQVGLETRAILTINTDCCTPLNEVLELWRWQQLSIRYWFRAYYRSGIILDSTCIVFIGPLNSYYLHFTDEKIGTKIGWGYIVNQSPSGAARFLFTLTYGSFSVNLLLINLQNDGKEIFSFT